ncbi:MAG: hypothetical protein LBB31_03305, partial [Prevotellaceae bacterium]|nr:hypothetical protein [Prevotellaceae bacterium]
TNSTNSYTTGSLSASAAYTVKVNDANNCESNTANGNITVDYPATSGSNAHPTCGCDAGLNDCSGVCKSSCGVERGSCNKDGWGVATTFQSLSDCSIWCAEKGYPHYDWTYISELYTHACYCCYN